MDPSIALYSLFAPFLLWPFEYLFPYPHVVEELAKTVIVFFVLKSKASLSQYLKTFSLAGVLFALSETVLYIINLNLFGRVSLIFVRFLSTAALHSLTFLIIAYLGYKNKKLLLVGLFIAILVHYLYNLLVTL